MSSITTQNDSQERHIYIVHTESLEMGTCQNMTLSEEAKRQLREKLPGTAVYRGDGERSLDNVVGTVIGSDPLTVSLFVPLEEIEKPNTFMTVVINENEIEQVRDATLMTTSADGVEYGYFELVEDGNT